MMTPKEAHSSVIELQTHELCFDIHVSSDIVGIKSYSTYLQPDTPAGVKRGVPAGSPSRRGDVAV